MASNGEAPAATSPKPPALASPKGGGGGQCLCSPTKHQGSFRCRFHRSNSSTTWMMRRSKSMPSADQSNTTNPVISKPLETVN